MKYNENVLSKTRQALFKSGVHYLSTDGTFYKYLKIGYVIFFIWVFFINISHIAACIHKINGHKQGFYILDDITLANIKNSITITIVFTIGIMVVYALCVLLKHIAAVSVGIPCCLIMIVHFKNMYADNILAFGIKSSYITRHFIPLFMLGVILGIMCFIAIKQDVIEKKAYNRFVDGLYEQYKQRQKRLSDDIDDKTAFVSLTDAEWKDYINNFADTEQKNIDLKKNKKQKDKNNPKKDR